MEEDLCGYMDWITQAEDMDELDEDGNPRKTDTVCVCVCAFVSLCRYIFSSDLFLQICSLTF